MVTSKSNNILVTDETQTIYQLTQFFNMFKCDPGAPCMLLSFASYALPPVNVTLQGFYSCPGSTPVTYTRPIYKFESIAFSEHEFFELIYLFRRAYGIEKISDQVVECVANWVRYNVNMFHPGLAHVCLSFFANCEKNMSDWLLANSDQLYQNVKDQRCFATEFDQFKVIFRQALEQKNFFFLIDKRIKRKNSDEENGIFSVYC